MKSYVITYETEDGRNAYVLIKAMTARWAMKTFKETLFIGYFPIVKVEEIS